MPARSRRARCSGAPARASIALQKQIDSVGDAVSNSLGALASGFMTAITTSGATTRMDNSTLQHCGSHMFSAGPQ